MKDKKITLAVNEEYQEYIKILKANNLNISAYLRSCIKDEVEKYSDVEDA